MMQKITRTKKTPISIDPPPLIHLFYIYIEQEKQLFAPPNTPKHIKVSFGSSALNTSNNTNTNTNANTNNSAKRQSSANHERYSVCLSSSRIFILTCTWIRYILPSQKLAAALSSQSKTSIRAPSSHGQPQNPQQSQSSVSKQSSQQDGNNKKRPATVEGIDQRHPQPNSQSAAAPIVQQQQQHQQEHQQHQTTPGEMPAGSKRFKFTMTKPNQTMKSTEEAAASWEAALAASAAPAAASPVTLFAAPVLNPQPSSSAARASIPASSTSKPQEETSKKPLEPVVISGAVGLTPYPVIPPSLKMPPVTANAAASTPTPLTADSHRKAFQDFLKKAGSSLPTQPPTTMNTTTLDSPTLESTQPILQIQSEQIHKLVTLNRELEKKNTTKDANISLMKQRIADLVAKEKQLESSNANLLQTLESERQSNTVSFEKLRAEHEGVRGVELQLRKHVEYLEKSLCVMQTQLERKEALLKQEAGNKQVYVKEMQDKLCGMEQVLSRERAEWAKAKAESEGRAAGLEQRISGILLEVEERKKEMVKVEARNKQTYVKEMEAKLARVDDILMRVREERDKIKREAEVGQGEKKRLEARIVEMEKREAEVDGERKTRESQYAELQGALSGHQAQIRQYQSNVSALGQEKSGLEARVVELENVIEKFQTSSSSSSVTPPPSSSSTTTASTMVTMSQHTAAATPSSSSTAQDYTTALHHTILQQRAKMAITDATVKLLMARKELSEAGVEAEIVDQCLPMPSRSGFESLVLGGKQQPQQQQQLMDMNMNM